MLDAIPDHVIASVGNELHEAGEAAVTVGDLHLAIAHLIRQWFSHPDNCTGGHFHIVVEDGNCSDRDLEYCMGHLVLDDELPHTVRMTGMLMGHALLGLGEPERDLVVRLGWPGGVSGDTKIDLTKVRGTVIAPRPWQVEAAP